MDQQVSRDFSDAPVVTRQETAGAIPVDAVPASPTRRPNKTRARIIQIVSVLLLIVLLVVLWRFLGDKAATPAGGGRGGRGGAGEVVPVEVASVTQQDVPIQIKGIGNTEALSTVAVRSQIEGTLMRVAFTPGQEVKKGYLLFTIDPRPLQAQLSEAEANLLKAMAAVRQANDIVARDEATLANDRIPEIG